jgi:hypothetical protein
MKNINEYLVNHMGSYEGKPMVNELFGTLFAGALIAWCLKDNIKTILDAAAQRRKDKWEHQEKMMNQAISAKDGDGKSGGLLSGLLGGLGILKMAGDATEQEKDPVAKEAQKSKLDIIRASYVDESGKERTPEERQKWLQSNMSPEDYKQMCETSQEAFLKADPKSVVDSAQAAGEKITDDDISKEFDKVKEAYGDLGKQLEADAQARRDLQDKIKQKEDEKAAKQEELDKAIADATASGDEAAIKQAKVLKAEFNKKMDIEIYNAKKAANDFEANCQTAKELNASNPGREDRIKTAAQKIEDDHKANMEAANKEISDNGGDPKNTDPKTEKQTKADADVKAAAEKLKTAQDKLDAAKKEVDELEKKAVEEKDPEKQAELKKQLDEKQKALNDAISEVEKASDDKEWADIAKEYADCNAESEKLHEQIGKIGPDEYMKKFQENYKKFEEVHKKAEEHTKKIEAKATGKSEAEPAKKEEPKKEEPKKEEPKKEEPKKEEPAKKEEPKKEEPKSDPKTGKEGEAKTEEIPGYDADGDTDGTKWVKTTDKDGNETYALLDKDGKKVDDASKEDFEQAKKDHEENAKRDDETNGEDEKSGDVDTDANDADGEEVDDGKGGKKKVLKNPAQIWHKKKNKATGKATKSYYNKKGDSISQDEFREKMKKYQAAKSKMKPESVSFSQFMSNHYIAESGKQYTSLRDSILKNIHD